MNSKDLTTIIIVAISGFVVSFLSLNAILGNPDEAKKEIKTITPISEIVDSPNSEIFNNEAINPTVEVYVGQKVEEESNETEQENLDSIEEENNENADENLNEDEPDEEIEE